VQLRYVYFGEVIAAHCIIVVIGMRKRALGAVHHSLHLVKSHCHVERQNIYNEKIINATVCYLYVHARKPRCLFCNAIADVLCVVKKGRVEKLSHAQERHSSLFSLQSG
jgi:hypothetical protein